MTTGARNCQNPVWSPEEKAIISAAWSELEAMKNHRMANLRGFYFKFDILKDFIFLKIITNPGQIYSRSLKAIQCEWLRQHPLLHSCPNSPLERELGIALDELEAMVA